MALPAHLIADLRHALRRFRAASGAAAVPAAAGRALEAWLAMRLATAAQSSGRWRVSLRRGDATPLPAGQPFAFPSYQSGILPASTAVAGHVLLERSEPTPVALELHLSLQWKGRSGSTHECDVSLVPTDIADPLRTSGGGHPRGLPIAAYECKDRGNVAPPDEMRQTLARLYDLVLVTRPYPGWRCRMFQAATTTRWGRWSSTYRSFFATGAFGVVRAGTFSPGARGLGDHYHIGRFGDVYLNPATILDVERSFMDVLDRIDFLI